MNSKITSILLFTIYCLLFTVFCGCASLLQKEKVLAVVNGEPLTEEDLKYSLTITHRREDLSSAGAMNLSEHVGKMVDDRLIIEDARRSGMDKYPEIQQAIQTYILRESVIRLHDEEIVQKVSVTEKEIKDYYKKNYERFTLGIIEMESEEIAGEVLEKLKKGDDFKELAKEYSIHPSKKEGGEVTLTRNAISTYIQEAISKLNSGEFSDIVKILNKYYIVKLIDRKEATDEEFNNVRRRIEKTIREQKEKERGDEYLNLLREKTNIKIDRELFTAIEINNSAEELKKWLKDERILAEVNGSSLTAGEFANMIFPRTRKSKEDILNNWIERKVIDHEALRRHYEKQPDLKKMIRRYEDQLLKRAFINRIIVPQISITDKALEDYYLSHQKDFMKPVRFKIQQVTAKTQEEAQEILDELKGGADFSWVAKKKSADPSAPKGGNVGWVTIDGLPEPARDIVKTLPYGEISPIIKVNSQYLIIKLQEKSEEEVEEFSKVRDAVYKACFNEQFNSILEKYTAQLKNEAHIKIYEDKIQSLQESLQK
ncbi:MAG: peptidyl-prolyl cis-trans isomerase [Nitrospirota bacterium]